MPKNAKRTIRFAVVGLGHFAQSAILPAFANTSSKVKLAAMVTGDKKKAVKLSRSYKVPAVLYDEYDELCSSGNIDAVYIALPNSQHREFTERAARVGIHVLCEKPLAHEVTDAEAMVKACKVADVRLMTAYRLHFEAGTLQAIKVVQSGGIGEARHFASVHTMQVDPENIRVDLSLGGGPLEDIGIYCINAARNVFQADPEEVVAFAVHGGDERFAHVPEAVSATMRFPGDRLATFLCGFGEAKSSEYRVIGSEGFLKMDPGFTWQGEISQTLIVGKKEKTKTFEHSDQIAAEIEYFAKCVINATEPEPSGAEGLIDVRIIDAIRRSYKSGTPVKIGALPADRGPKPSQSIKKKPHREPQTVKVSPPSKRS